MNAWKLVYGNDTGPMDDDFMEFWDVVNEKTGMSFRTDTKSDAEFLVEVLNHHSYVKECM